MINHPTLSMMTCRCSGQRPRCNKFHKSHFLAIVTTLAFLSPVVMAFGLAIVFLAGLSWNIPWPTQGRRTRDVILVWRASEPLSCEVGCVGSILWGLAVYAPCVWLCGPHVFCGAGCVGCVGPVCLYGGSSFLWGAAVCAARVWLCEPCVFCGAGCVGCVRPVCLCGGGCAGLVCRVGLHVRAPCVLWGWLCGSDQDPIKTTFKVPFTTLHLTSFVSRAASRSLHVRRCVSCGTGCVDSIFGGAAVCALCVCMCGPCVSFGPASSHPFPTTNFPIRSRLSRPHPAWVESAQSEVNDAHRPITKHDDRMTHTRHPPRISSVRSNTRCKIDASTRYTRRNCILLAQCYKRHSATQACNPMEAAQA